MREEDKNRMEQYEITSLQKIIYLYKGNMYDNLKDAINYAIIDDNRK